MGTRFRTMLAPIGMSTGDGRRLKAGGITLADVPFPFEWVRSREGGHTGAVTVGVVNEATLATVKDAVSSGWIGQDAAKGLDADTEAVWGRGEFFDVDRDKMPRLAQDVAEAMHLVSEGTLGPSIDLDSFEATPVQAGTDEPIRMEDVLFEGDDAPKVELLITEGRVRAATLVSIPAFAETSRPLEIIADEALVASVTGSTGLPIGDRGLAWDGPAAARRVFSHFTSGDSVDTAGVAKAFLYRDPEADASTQAAYKLGFADIVDGTLTIVPRGVAACAGGRGVSSTKGIPSAEKTRIQSKICSLYTKIRNKYGDWPDCPFSSDTQAALIASVAAAELPAAARFDAPSLNRPTPISFDFEAGTVIGHIATWATCHGGYPDVCITPPRDPGDGYAWFHRYPVDTADGIVWAGRITVGGLHPSLDLSAGATMAQYDSKTTAAYVRAYEDQHGIAVVGILSPDLDGPARGVLERRKVSADWRETPKGLSLIELLALSPGPARYSEPGFPVSAYSHRGRQTALTACLGPDPDTSPQTGASGIDVDALAEAIEMASMRRKKKRQCADDLAEVLAADAEAVKAQARAELNEAIGADG